MTSRLLAAALILLVGSTSVALAESAEGVIKAINDKHRTITLEDGMEFVLPEHVKVDALKVGEKVKVEWPEKHRIIEAHEVVVVK
ncbi:MAG: DUF1344 domain-containing protein [Proteobacteria bacterium]|nr:DUF1344 domain-containing protein [Pseudomonadota bacterium]MBS0572478.1 DUF1344 domain-containing protein [Pseudomonadota bacterium]